MWNAKTKKHYVQLGYRFTNMNDKFLVKTEDLTHGSNVPVRVKCDYCGEEFSMEYYRYISSKNEEVKMDCCNRCKKYKIRDTLLQKHGVETPDKVDCARDKAYSTNMILYGARNPFSSEDIKKKIEDSNIKKYGYACANRNADVQEKRKKTCIERYGVDSHMKSEKYRKLFSGANSPRWKPDKSSCSRIRDRSCIEYRQWRTDVFARDGYICQRCGGRGDKKFGIEAHHIVNYSSVESLRFEIDNGITLCHECHNLFHKTYGKTNNTQEQLSTFMSHGKKVC